MGGWLLLAIMVALHKSQANASGPKIPSETKIASNSPIKMGSPPVEDMAPLRERRRQGDKATKRR